MVTIILIEHESQLGIDASQLDLSQFNSSNTIPAGIYRLQIEINRNILSEQDVNFVCKLKRSCCT